jgi:hypothetical protein
LEDARVDPQVIVVNFSSVLQLAFGTNILSLLSELKPIVDKQWQKLDSKIRAHFTNHVAKGLGRAAGQPKVLLHVF